uniref:Uncharacterized protein n=1 Tax=Chromera velia CCMP2878 TaxID=1169474 RepID=A0A0G4FEX3_9ALVE|eukprot:Cvel_16516.t1-p1 / transcript=Cvel_16516.t1 / gene=Cvel_16516 / organism=Chromera_velia_CCMP2878 / gene_product=hypothetical protein / transcript_product=hypothetical protein / location=Cvel_scaffold1274:2500-5354(+) / protein_length=563 / sequence_SO=supercontig / SO=protein_coding / is_pseudo=false
MKGNGGPRGDSGASRWQEAKRKDTAAESEQKKGGGVSMHCFDSKARTPAWLSTAVPSFKRTPFPVEKRKPPPNPNSHSHAKCEQWGLSSGRQEEGTLSSHANKGSSSVSSEGGGGGGILRQEREVPFLPSHGGNGEKRRTMEVESDTGGGNRQTPPLGPLSPKSLFSQGDMFESAGDGERPRQSDEGEEDEEAFEWEEEEGGEEEEPPWKTKMIKRYFGPHLHPKSSLSCDGHDTALSIAKKKGHAECVRLLEAALFREQSEKAAKVLQDHFRQTTEAKGEGGERASSQTRKQKEENKENDHQENAATSHPLAFPQCGGAFAEMSTKKGGKTEFSSHTQQQADPASACVWYLSGMHSVDALKLRPIPSPTVCEFQKGHLLSHATDVLADLGKMCLGGKGTARKPREGALWLFRALNLNASRMPGDLVSARCYYKKSLGVRPFEKLLGRLRRVCFSSHGRGGLQNSAVRVDEKVWASMEDFSAERQRGERVDDEESRLIREEKRRRREEGRREREEEQRRYGMERERLSQEYRKAREEERERVSQENRRAREEERERFLRNTET